MFPLHRRQQSFTQTRHAQHMIPINLQTLMTVARASPIRCAARAFYATAGGTAPTGSGSGDGGGGSRSSVHGVPTLTLKQVHYPITLRAPWISLPSILSLFVSPATKYTSPQFILRHRVLNLYRAILRSLRRTSLPLHLFFGVYPAHAPHTQASCLFLYN